jgi:hypothetical protein
MIISLMIDLPDDLAQDFLQSIRVFDMKHDPNREGKVKIAWFGKSKDIPFEELKAIMESVDPPFEFIKTFKNGSLT